MTKFVRIENACTSDYEVIVEIWEKTKNGDMLVNTIELPFPTSIMTDQYITSTRYMVVREKQKD